MGVVLKNSAPAWSNPWQGEIDAKQAAASVPVAPMYTPEEIAARKQSNADAYRWAMANAMMGDEQQARVGGQVLQQALAGRQERVTDKGVFDPLSGTMRENTQYARERAQDQLDAAQQRYANAGFQHGETQGSQAFQAEQQGRSQAFQAGQSDTQFGHQKELEQMRIGAENERARIAAGAKAGGTPNENENASAGFAMQMLKAGKTIKDLTAPSTDPTTGAHLPSGRETTGAAIVGSVPILGDYFKRKWNTEEQQVFQQAQDAWIGAKLRSESGANYGPKEVENERRTFFPLPGEDDETVARKAAAREIAEAGMMQKAGRAFTPAAERYNAMQPQVETPKLNVSRVTPNAAPAAPRGMLPRARAAQAGQPDPFAPALGINYGPTAY